MVLGTPTKDVKILNYIKKTLPPMESFFFKRHTAVYLKKVYGLTNGVEGKIQSYSLMKPPMPEVC